MASSNGASAAQEYCNSFSGNPVLPSYTGKLQCGLQTLNHTLMESCCSGEVQQYQTCFLYCAPKGKFQDFVSCVSLPGSANIRSDAFCQRNVVSTVEESISNDKSTGGGTSFGARTASTPKISSLLLLALLTTLLLNAPATATIVAPFGLISRSSCTFTLHSHFNKTGKTLTLTPDFGCSDSNFCNFGGVIDTGMMNNNRTLHGKSAADSSYDSFFGTLSKSGGAAHRLWPAMSGAKMFYEWIGLGGTTTRVSWTVVQARVPLSFLFL